MEKRKNKFCAGIVNPNKSVQEIEELYRNGISRERHYGNRTYTETIEAKFMPFEKARAMFDKMYDVLASGKTKIAVH
jgi:hypothetical protein